MTSLFSRHRRLIQFAVVGVLGVFVNMAGVWGVLQALAAAPISSDGREAIASFGGIFVSVFSNFILNDLWTWGDREKGGRWLARLLRYYAVSAAAGGVQFAVAVALSVGLQVNIFAAQLVGIVLGTGINYVANNRWTFRNR